MPYQVYKLTGSTALVGLLGLASLVPLLVVPLVGGAIADALDRRTVLLRTETGHGVDHSALPGELAAAAPAGLGALRAAGGRGRCVQPRPAGDELACAAARARRRDRRRGRARQRLQLARRGRRPGGRRRADLASPVSRGPSASTPSPTSRRSSPSGRCRSSRRSARSNGRACARSARASGSSRANRR